MAQRIWRALGQPVNFIEPFFGSGAVLLLRPEPVRGVETINDADHYVANFWRSIQRGPEAVAAHADGPVIEVDLHARHRWLVYSDHAAAWRERMRSDPDHYDARIAGWWCWGLCCWIGGGWCADGVGWVQPLRSPERNSLSGVGVHAKGGTHLRQKMPEVASGRGVTQAKGGRPQLADAYDVGRGVHSGGHIGTCEARRQWLTDWFARLADRLRLVRVCCGDWSRVCSSPSTTTRLGLTGVFLDPPYPVRQKKGGKKSRDAGLYATDAASDTETLRDQVLAWCREYGGQRLMRICVAGYEGDGYEALVRDHGWREEPWKAQGGYGNRTEEGKANAARERLWFSPHCQFDATLFDQEAPA